MALLPAYAGPAPVGSEPVVVPSRIEFVSSARPPARRPDQGLLVLDLVALESAEAALELAQSWRRRQSAGRELICWLRAPVQADLLDALGALTQTEAPPCSRILVPR